LYATNATRPQTNLTRRRRREVNNAAMAEGATVIDANYHLLARPEVGDAHTGTKG
jgi:hypothetical protein